ncbi:MAG: hypothetical protein RL885_25000 [Planctomycetota bacterium]
MAKPRKDAIEIARRRARVSELHDKCMTSAEIAREVGVTVRQVERDIEAILEEYAARYAGHYRETVIAASKRCEGIFRDLREHVDSAESDEVRATYYGLLLRTLERFCAILGLDARKETGGSPIFRQPKK